MSSLDNLTIPATNTMINGARKENLGDYRVTVIFTSNHQDIELFVAKNKTAASVMSDSLDTPIHVAAK